MPWEAMSLLAGLDNHERTPGDHWGRFSSRTTNRTTNGSISPENDEVALLPEPSTSRNMRINGRELRKRNSARDPIVIKEDRAPQSTTDRKPGEYVCPDNFIIPKTKRETRSQQNSSSTTSDSNNQWLSSRKSQSGPPSNKTHHPVRLNRDWTYTTAPRTSSNKVSSSEALKQIQQYESVELDDDKPDDEVVDKSTLDVTPKRFRKAFKNRNLDSELKNERISLSDGEAMDEDGQEDNKNERSEAFDPRNFFCPACGGTIGKTECLTCKRKVSENQEKSSFPTIQGFYGSKSNNPSMCTIKYSGKGIKTSQPTMRRKGSRKISPSPSNTQTRINNLVETKKPVKRRPKKVKTRPDSSPELVNIISSDEEGQETETSPTNCNNEASSNDMDEGHPNDETLQQSREQSPTPMETTEPDVPEEDHLDVVKKKRSKSARTLNAFQRDDIKINFPVNEINVGRLHGKPSAPVEIDAENIKIQLLLKETPYIFKLMGSDLKSFKISNYVGPPYIVIEPTPGWARKMNERYSSSGTFIDPGSAVCDERQILLMLSEQIDKEKLADLVELINDTLSGSRVFKTIKPEKAKIELERMVSGKIEDSEPDFLVKRPASSTSLTHNNTLSSSILPRKSYNTRSKDSSAINYPKKTVEKVLVYPPLSKAGGVTITTEDVECLQPDTYLNDVIIDFFLKYLFEEELSEEDRTRTHIFSSFFYKRLTFKKHGVTKEQRTPEIMHNMVKSWTKNVDIFSKDFIILPINECSHWYLAIICYPQLLVAQEQGNTEEEIQNDGSFCSNIFQGLLDSPADEKNGLNESKKNDSDEDDDDVFDKPVLRIRRNIKSKRKKSQEKVPIKSRPCLLIFDSLSHTGRSQMMVNLRNYLTCEWKERRGNEMSLTFDKNNLKACYPKVPCQNNSSDCGVYLLQYVESFFKNPIEDYNFPISRPDWFPLQVIEEKREYLKNLIYKLKERVQIED